MNMTYITDYALALIKEGLVDDAYRILKQAEGFCTVGRFSPSAKYRILLLNHLGCCMRRFNKNKTARSYLSAALKLSQSTSNPELIATTCLNLCAVYRELEDHRKVISCNQALEYAKKASSEFSHLIINYNPMDFESRAAYEETYRDKTRLLAICYHNLSSEEEHFGNREKSLEYAKKAYQLMKSKFGDTNHFTKKFKSIYYSKLNSDLVENTSTVSLLDARVPRAGSAGKSQVQPISTRAPQWKIKKNPYASTKPSPFHKHCVPHPDYSQFAGTKQDKDEMSDTQVPKAFSLATFKKTKREPVRILPSHPKDQPVDSSSGSEVEESEKQMEKNRMRFLKELEGDRTKRREANAKKKLKNKQEEENEAKIKKEEQRKREREARSRDEQEARDKEAKLKACGEILERSAIHKISTFLKCRTLSRKQMDNSSFHVTRSERLHLCDEAYRKTARRHHDKPYIGHD